MFRQKSQLQRFRVNVVAAALKGFDLTNHRGLARMLTKEPKQNKFIPDEVQQPTTWNNLNHRPVKFDQDGIK